MKIKKIPTDKTLQSIDMMKLIDQRIIPKRMYFIDQHFNFYELCTIKTYLHNNYFPMVAIRLILYCVISMSR